MLGDEVNDTLVSSTLRLLAYTGSSNYGLTSRSFDSVWRSTLILTFASCYIMWGKSAPPRLWSLVCAIVDIGDTAITFLAQLHPLIEPKSSTLRPGYEAD
jgi:hypothetical protein